MAAGTVIACPAAIETDGPPRPPVSYPPLEGLGEVGEWRGAP